MSTRTAFFFGAFLLATNLLILTGCGSTNTSTNGSGGGSIAVPATPSGLVATGGNAQVSLSWTVSPGAISYNVKRSTTSDGPYSQIGAPTPPFAPL